MKTILAIVFILMSCELVAGEADHYSDRDLPLEDVSAQLNKLATEYLYEATNQLNQLASCNDSMASEKALYKAMTTYFANHSKGLLVKEILYKNYIPKRMIALKDSVYAKWSILNGYIIGRKGAANSPLALTPMIRIGDHVIGIDKLEHMFGMGQKYFKKYHLKNKKLRRVLKQGIASEKTFLGGNILATGVFAYADLSANFNGMRFWNHILQKRDDILGKKHNIGPYVRCVAGNYEVVKENPIDFKNYIDASMDESINCSKFASKAALRKFKKGITAVDQAYTCPMSSEILKSMYAKYNVVTPRDKKRRAISHWILNNDGNEKVSYFNEF